MPELERIAKFVSSKQNKLISLFVFLSEEGKIYFTFQLMPPFEDFNTAPPSPIAII